MTTALSVVQYTPVGAVAELLAERPVWAHLTTTRCPADIGLLMQDVEDAVRLLPDDDPARLTWRQLSRESRRVAVARFEQARQATWALLPELPPAAWRTFMRAAMQMLDGYWPDAIQAAVVCRDGAGETAVAGPLTAARLLRLDDARALRVAGERCEVTLTWESKPGAPLLRCEHVRLPRGMSLPPAFDAPVAEPDYPDPTTRFLVLVHQAIDLAMRAETWSATVAQLAHTRV